MICSKCGNNIDEGAVFCGKCGNPVSDEQPEMSLSSAKPAARKTPLYAIIGAVIGVVAIVITAALFLFLPNRNKAINDAAMEISTLDADMAVMPVPAIVTPPEEPDTPIIQTPEPEAPPPESEPILAKETAAGPEELPPEPDMLAPSITNTPEEMAETPLSSFEYTINEAGDGFIITKFVGEEAQVRIPALIKDKPVTRIGVEAFKEADVSYVLIPNSVTGIDDYAFSDSTVADVDLGKGVINIGTGAFSYCTELLYITIPDGVTAIGDYAFSRSGLMGVDFGKSAASVGIEAFSYCAELLDLTIPEGMTEISDFAFSHCINLSTVNMPKGLYRSAIFIDSDKTAIYAGRQPSRPLKDVALYDKAYIAVGDVGEFRASGDNGSNHITLYANGRIEGKAVHENYVVYQVDGFAEAFKAVLLPLNKRGGDAVYRIYGDDRLLYTSPSIGAGSPDIPCEINISGVKKIRIELVQNANKWRWGGGEDTNPGLANAVIFTSNY